MKFFFVSCVSLLLSLQADVIVHSENTFFSSFINEPPDMAYYSEYKVPFVGTMLIDQTKDIVKNELRAGRVWETYIIVEISKHVKPGDVALDIGSHFGSIAIPMARFVGDKGKVIAFECDWNMARELYWNANANDISNIEIYNYFLGDVEKEIVWPGYGVNYSPAHHQKVPGTIKQITIDSLDLDRVDLIKMDVECTEDQVLEGARETLLKHRPVIIIEIMGGFGVHPNKGGWQKTVPEVRDRIKKTITTLETLGYSVTQLWTDDFLAIHKKPMKEGNL